MKTRRFNEGQVIKAINEHPRLESNLHQTFKKSLTSATPANQPLQLLVPHPAHASVLELDSEATIRR